MDLTVNLSYVSKNSGPKTEKELNKKSLLQSTTITSNYSGIIVIQEPNLLLYGGQGLQNMKLLTICRN